jgi:broad specificity phosphatase PhoE
MKALLIRHGEIDSNLKKLYSGRSQEPLNDHGREQATRLGDELALGAARLDAIFTSPLPRTHQTAQLVAERIRAARGTSVPVILDEGLTELGMGPWEGLTEDRVAELYPTEWKLWHDRPAELTIPGRETLAQAADRAMTTLKRIKDGGANGRVAIVTHYAVVRLILLSVRGESLNRYKTISVPNCSTAEVEI